MRQHSIHLSPPLAPFYFIKSSDKPLHWGGFSWLPCLRGLQCSLWFPQLASCSGGGGGAGGCTLIGSCSRVPGVAGLIQEHSPPPPLHCGLGQVTLCGGGAWSSIPAPTPSLPGPPPPPSGDKWKCLRCGLAFPGGRIAGLRATVWSFSQQVWRQMVW